MAHNGYRVRSSAELSPYQKRIENIENVILCVAEAEKLVSELGRSLLEDMAPLPQPSRQPAARKMPRWTGAGRRSHGQKRPEAVMPQTSGEGR